MKATARLFKNGGSRAIRLPKQFRFPGKTVTLQRTKGGILIKTAQDREQRLMEAAKAYQALLHDHPKERTEMDAWESTSLADQTSGCGVVC